MTASYGWRAQNSYHLIHRCSMINDDEAFWFNSSIGRCFDYLGLLWVLFLRLCFYTRHSARLSVLISEPGKVRGDGYAYMGDPVFIVLCFIPMKLFGGSASGTFRRYKNFNCVVCLQRFTLSSRSHLALAVSYARNKHGAYSRDGLLHFKSSRTNPIIHAACTSN